MKPHAYFWPKPKASGNTNFFFLFWVKLIKNFSNFPNFRIRIENQQLSPSLEGYIGTRTHNISMFYLIPCSLHLYICSMLPWMISDISNTLLTMWPQHSSHSFTGSMTHFIYLGQSSVTTLTNRVKWKWCSVTLNWSNTCILLASKHGLSKGVMAYISLVLFEGFHFWNPVVIVVDQFTEKLCEETTRRSSSFQPSKGPSYPPASTTRLSKDTAKWLKPQPLSHSTSIMGAHTIQPHLSPA